MSTIDLRNRLHDVARDPASQVRVDARAAWTDGARRRVRRRLIVGAAGVAAVTAVVAAVPLTRAVDLGPSGTDDAGARAEHHPRRLDHLYVDRDMPAVTGPLAGVVQRNGEDVGGWYAVSPHGQMWRIDDAHDIPVLSPHGTHLAYLRGSEYRTAVFAITNQLTGTVVRFPKISLGVTVNDVPTTDAPYFHSDQMPRFWNADGTAVLIQLGNMTTRRDEVAAGVLSLDGTIQLVRNSTALPDGSHPIGWFDDKTAAFVSRLGKQVHVSAVDVATSTVTRSFALDGRVQSYSQWYASLSPGGGTVMTIDDTDTFDLGPARFHSAQGENIGDVRVKMPVPTNFHDHCQPTWTSSEVYLPVFQTEEDAHVLYRINGGTPIVADPDLEIACSVWASSALEGGPDPSIGGWLFGTQDTWLSWHWRELTTGVLAGLALLTLGFAPRRRRRR